HLFLTLERLEALRRRDDPAARPLQRIGLSATQRPLEEVARLLGGGTVDAAGEWQPRPVTIAAPPGRKAWALSIEVPVEAAPAEPPGEDVQAQEGPPKLPRGHVREDVSPEGLPKLSKGHARKAMSKRS